MTSLLIGGSGLRPVTLVALRASASPDQVARKAVEVFERLTRTAPFKSRSHGLDHPLRMLSNLQLIGERAGDLKVLTVAIILHDIGVFYTQDAAHGKLEAQRVRYHLGTLGLSKDEQDRVCSIIASHHGEAVDNSIEAKALRALDALDAFSAIGVYRYLEIYTRRGLLPPQIFSEILKNMSSRHADYDRSFFSLGEIALAAGAALKADLAVSRMLEEFKAGNSSDAVQILIKLEEEKWDLAFLNSDEKMQALRSAAPAAYAFFVDLKEELV